MASGWLLPFVAGAISAVFSALVWAQWARARRPYQLAWGLGLAAYALAALAEAWANVAGWTPALHRGYFAVAGGNVGLLGLGTILLVLPRTPARAASAVVAALILLAALGQFAVPLDAAELRAAGGDLGADPIPYPHPARIGFGVLSALGGLALIVGALWSWWRTRRAGVLLIGLGAMLPFAGGSLSTLAGLDARVMLQFVGIAVMFAGYLQGRESRPARPATAPAEA